MRKILALFAITSMSLCAYACGPQEAGPTPPPGVRGPAGEEDPCLKIKAPDGGTPNCPPGCRAVGDHCESDRGGIVVPQPPA